MEFCCRELNCLSDATFEFSFPLTGGDETVGCAGGVSGTLDRTAATSSEYIAAPVAVRV